MKEHLESVRLPLPPPPHPSLLVLAASQVGYFFLVQCIFLIASLLFFACHGIVMV